ncbi:mannose-1-phosphate guanylyltransferase [Sulfuriroseicoccus oceanibius]|uniref:Mannose-1-phosphate guanylyltransferase n=1 Tax=Sulfuriroseicoccus oceanibius TaxID=2707525 RepID=A0A6B3LDV6_9BACT|nr:sugar phosphate nucleotidyltransferase [Sulfuriroseicoccus oceanibius]QQL45435.1 mannose-1-phosphate guanylyltransferase [Sulfuriroseicoccus oceanibius]
MNTPNVYAVILAGGSGQRFWPLSRNNRPKQLLNLFGDTTLLEDTIRRLDGIVPPERVLIVTNAVQQPAAIEIASACGVPAENVVAEPERRDTAPAIAFATGWVAAKDPNAVMAVLPSDQRIADRAAFQSVLGTAVATAAAEPAILTIGIKPTWACPGYGYIEVGETVANTEGDAIVRDVVRFREKPTTEVAEQFLADGGFVWNAGMFIWSVATARNELSEHCPELAAFIDETAQATNPLDTLESSFRTLPKISIDFALMEKASRVMNVEATFDWDDVGSWISVAAYLEADANGNRSNIEITSVDSRNNIVFSENADPTNISLVGVQDLIIVRTRTATLVANRHSADDIKKLIELLPSALH